MEKEELLKNWLKYKNAEEKAKKNRYEMEKNIEALYGTDFSESSKTFNEEKFKIILKKNIVHKLDNEAWLSVRNDIPENLRPEKISFSLDVNGFNYLKDNGPEDVYKKVSDCVEIKQNKTTITVEKI